MKEHPILFSAPMVRALLDGSKTQTRRVVKPQPPAHVIDFSTFHNPKGEGLAHFGFDPVKRELQDWFAVCPYGQPGDRLWVREAWGYIDPDNTGEDYDDDDGPGPVATYTPELLKLGNPLRDFWLRRIAYRATWKDPKYGCGPDSPKRWRPSIHMPRWVSRITLEVVSVRVERLQDISEADAQAEGVNADDFEYFHNAEGTETARESYQCLWEQINGLGSWDANPWVWVVEFRKVTP